MGGPIFNPQQPVDVAEVTDPAVFRDALEKMARARGRAPKVKVIIQVRGAVATPAELQRRFIAAHRALATSEMPEEERVQKVASRLQDPDSRNWEDAEVVDSGRPDHVKLPEPGELDRVQRETGADEVRVAVRAV